MEETDSVRIDPLAEFRVNRSPFAPSGVSAI